MVKHLILALALAASTASAGICESVGNIYGTAYGASEKQVPIMSSLNLIRKTLTQDSDEDLRIVMTFAIASAYADQSAGRSAAIGRDLVVSECELQGVEK